MVLGKIWWELQTKSLKSFRWFLPWLGQMWTLQMKLFGQPLMREASAWVQPLLPLLSAYSPGIGASFCLKAELISIPFVLGELCGKVSKTKALLISMRAIAMQLFPTFCWNIWRERNAKVFTSKDSTLDIILRDILQWVRTKDIFLNLDFSPAIFASWNLPQTSPHQAPRCSTHSPSAWNLVAVFDDNQSVGAFKDNSDRLLRLHYIAVITQTRI